MPWREARPVPPSDVGDEIAERKGTSAVVPPTRKPSHPVRSSATNVTAAIIGDFMDEKVSFVSRCLFHSPQQRAATCQRLLA